MLPCTSANATLWRRGCEFQTTTVGNEKQLQTVCKGPDGLNSYHIVMVVLACQLASTASALERSATTQSCCADSLATRF